MTKIVETDEISPTLDRTEAAYDAYMTLARRFAASPSRDLASEVETAYRAFYLAFVGKETGIEEELADLRTKMAKRMGP